MKNQATCESASGQEAVDFWNPLSPEDAARLAALEERFEGARSSLVGYPANQAFDYDELFRFWRFAGNNVGDPFGACGADGHTHDFEREVVGKFAELLSGDSKSVWGYVTGGGTEGNLYGLYLARESLPGATVYCSDHAHYSVEKCLHLLGMRSEAIRSRPNGEIDYDHLSEIVSKQADASAIVVANIGTMMKGAIDDVEKIRDVLAEANVTQSYIHCDAALSGLILPFVDDPPKFDFAAGADSIAVSGHKLIGTPVPCGVVLARKKHVDRIAGDDVPYISGTDTTIGGSRSALSPLLLWYAVRRLGRVGLAQLVEHCLELADYTIARFADHGIDAWRHRHSITVVFPRPVDAVLSRWQIATHGDIAQLIALPHVTEDIVDRFVEDCATLTGKERTRTPSAVTPTADSTANRTVCTASVRPTRL